MAEVGARHRFAARKGMGIRHVAARHGADITSPTAPPLVQEVAAALSRALGHPVTVQLGWIPVRDPEHSQPDSPQLPLSELSPVVE